MHDIVENTLEASYQKRIQNNDNDHEVVIKSVGMT